MMQVTEQKCSIPVLRYIERQGVDCAHMPCLRRPGHICCRLTDQDEHCVLSFLCCLVDLVMLSQSWLVTQAAFIGLLNIWVWIDRVRNGSSGSVLSQSPVSFVFIRIMCLQMKCGVSPIYHLECYSLCMNLCLMLSAAYMDLCSYNFQSSLVANNFCREPHPFAHLKPC